MKVLVTGAAGFVGHFTALALLRAGHQVMGIDNLNDYYAVSLKQARLSQSRALGLEFTQLDIADRQPLEALFKQHHFDQVIHLAAQAGVRYSLENPHSYIESNVVGFTNLLECCRHNNIGHFIYASSSSVYGLNTKLPYAASDGASHPASLYAATKRSNELFAHSYSHLYGIPTTGLRFFTVYGPWGRPDMAYYTFTRDILAGTPIKLFNNGDMQRDFTYIDDVVESIVRLLDHPPTANTDMADQTELCYRDPSSAAAPYRLFNIGNHSPVRLGEFVATIENALGIEAIKEYYPMQPGDVQATFADVEPLANAVGFSPATPLAVGIDEFVTWYRSYYKV